MASPKLNSIRVARPCPSEWEAMRGSDRVRHCADCDLNVYNLSALSAEDAQVLIEETEGRLCVRFYRRADGTILTQNCPGEVDIPRERLNTVLLTLAFVALWATMVPVNDVVWNLADRAVRSAAHTISNAVGPDEDGAWVSGMMVETPDEVVITPRPVIPNVELD